MRDTFGLDPPIGEGARDAHPLSELRDRDVLGFFYHVHILYCVHKEAQLDPSETLPDGKKMTPGNIERYAAKADSDLRRNATQLLAAELSRSGEGASDGSYTGTFSSLSDPTTPGRPNILIATFLRGVCIQAARIDMDDFRHMAMDYVVEPAYAAAAIEAMEEREEVKPTLWKPGDE